MPADHADGDAEVRPTRGPIKPRDPEVGPGAGRLVVFAGLSGTGKSSISRALASELRAAWIRVDAIEAGEIESGLERSFETGLAAYVGARNLARDQLAVGLDVIIDAVNAEEEGRELWRALATETGVRRFVVHVSCSDAQEHRRRVEYRISPTPPLPPLTWEEVTHRKEAPWIDPHLEIDAVNSISHNLERIRAFIARG